MEKIDLITKFNYKKWLAVILAIFLFLSLCLGGNLLWIKTKYTDKFYPGVHLAGINLGGLTKNQATKIFKAKIDEFNREGQTFFYQNKKISINPLFIAQNDPDLSQEIINFSLDDSLNKVYQIGRQENYLKNLWSEIKLLFTSNQDEVNFEVNEEKMFSLLKNNFGGLETAGWNPHLKINGDQITITPEKIGLSFDYARAIDKLKQNLEKLDFQAIELQLAIKQPDFQAKDAEYLLETAKNILQLTPVELKLEQKTKSGLEKITLSKNDLSKLLDLNWNELTRQPELIFKEEELEKILAGIKEQIEQKVVEAKFSFANDKVTEFKPAQAGVAIDWSKTLTDMQEKIIKNKENSALIITSVLEPQITTDAINDLGIKELLGVGESSYAGSPVNRRVNIKVGAEWLNGLLIKPGETFSLNEALGEIDAKKGYLPELVIKGTKTVPEYGGGLCQIATTMFRLALNTGLSIPERKPHAYRVSYYEPAGTDATIYSPSPDLKITNDTSNYLLIQTYNNTEESKLRFEFWGTSDGRQATTTAPKIFNIVPAGETKYVETTDLPPQKIKCTETAHAGADAEFKRTITYLTGETKEEIWSSHYRPWQAVCLVGVDPSKIATSTPTIITP